MASGGPSPEIFAYLGHGNEEPVPYNERPKVPEGSTVVLLTQPGKPFTGISAFMVTNLMKTNPELFKNPMKHKAEIESMTDVQLRIYPEGTPMPVMNYWPEGSQPNTSMYGGMSFYVSGLFRLPLPFDSIFKRDYKSFSIPVADVPILYPGVDNAELRELILSKPSPENSSKIPVYTIKQIQYTTPELVAKQGPGIHYFLNCRYIANLSQKIHEFMTPLYKELTPLVGKVTNANTFKRELNRIQTYELPENRLVPLRQALVEYSGLEGDTTVQTNEEFAANTTEYPDDPFTKFAVMKRKYTKQFNEQFKPLQNKVKLTRQKSEEFQRGLFSPGGGAGAAGSSRKRRTRKSRTRRRR